MSIEDSINDFLSSSLYSILSAEEKELETICGGELSLNEIHVIEAVIKAQEAGENNFSTVAKLLDITLGTLTKSYSKLEAKGYLVKEQDKNDKRIYYIFPTKIAQSINDSHQEFHRRVAKSIVERLPRKSLQSLADSFDALKKYLNEVM